MVLSISSLFPFLMAYKLTDSVQWTVKHLKSLAVCRWGCTVTGCSSVCQDLEHPFIKIVSATPHDLGAGGPTDAGSYLTVSGIEVGITYQRLNTTRSRFWNHIIFLNNNELTEQPVSTFSSREVTYNLTGCFSVLGSPYMQLIASLCALTSLHVWSWLLY